MSDIISWDKAIDMKVKSSDNEDLGKIQSITRDYIQTKEGTVSKNYYFIPKYYIQGFDGKDIWVSLTKSDVQSQFEREEAPGLNEVETTDYINRKNSINAQYPDFATNIPKFDNFKNVPSIGLAWDKMIGKKLKSSDNKDLGEIRSVSSDYVETKEGLVNKKRYFVPRFLIQGFDGDSLYCSMTKDDIGNFERDSPPTPEELQTAEYIDRRNKFESSNPQFLHGVPWMAKEPGLTLANPQTGDALNIPWEEVIHKHVRSADNVDVGDIERVGNDFIVIRDGVARVHIFYVPKAYVTNYDGSSIWIDVPSSILSSKFERSAEPTENDLKTLIMEGEEKKRSRLSARGEKNVKPAGAS